MSAAPLSEWFAHVDLTGAPDPAGLVADELVRFLEHSRPTKLDRARSSVKVVSQSWGREVEFRLAHADGPKADLLLVVQDIEATLYWVSTHEHITPEDGTPERHWSSVAIDAVAAVVRGEYEVEEVRRGGRLVKSRLIDRATGRVLGVSGGLFAWMRPGRSVVGTRERLDFGCQD